MTCWAAGWIQLFIHVAADMADGEHAAASSTSPVMGNNCSWLCCSNGGSIVLDGERGCTRWWLPFVIFWGGLLCVAGVFWWWLCGPGPPRGLLACGSVWSRSRPDWWNHQLLGGSSPETSLLKLGQQGRHAGWDYEKIPVGVAKLTVNNIVKLTVLPTLICSGACRRREWSAWMMGSRGKVQCVGVCLMKLA